MVKIRKGLGYTQMEMSILICIKRSLLGAIEEGRTLSIETVYKVSIKFGYTIDELITQLI